MRTRKTVALVAAMGVLLGAEPVAGVKAQRTAQADPSITSVKTMDELKASTADEKAEALYFGPIGRRQLEPGVNAAQGPGLVTTPEGGWPKRPAFDDFMRDNVCRGDVVLLGHTRSGKTLLNSTGMWLFTDFTVEVSEWARPVAGPSTVIISVLGGRAIVGGLRTSARPEDLQRDRQYVLFGRHLSGSGNFVRSGPVFSVDETGKLSALASVEDELPVDFGQRAPNVTAFLKAARAASGNCDHHGLARSSDGAPRM